MISSTATKPANLVPGTIHAQFSALFARLKTSSMLPRRGEIPGSRHDRGLFPPRPSAQNQSPEVARGCSPRSPRNHFAIRKRGWSNRTTAIGENIRFSHRFDRHAEPDPRSGGLGQLKKWQFLSPSRVVASELTPFRRMRILNHESEGKKNSPASRFEIIPTRLARTKGIK